MFSKITFRSFSGEDLYAPSTLLGPFRQVQRDSYTTGFINTRAPN